VQVEQLYEQASQVLNMPADRFKLVLRGSAVIRAADDPGGSGKSSKQRIVQLAEGGEPL